MTSIPDVKSTSRGWAWLGLVAALAIAAFAYSYALTNDLFVWTEARGMMLYAWSGDLAQWLLFPILNYGAGRLTGIFSFQLTGQLCGVDSGCVNAVGALMTAVAVVFLLLHTRQVTRSTGIAASVSVLWLLSPAVLGISIWQSARFDILAFIGAMAAGMLWWNIFGRRRLSPAWMLFAVVASILIMAFSFNAKEVMYYLVGLLLFLAVVRGAGMRGAIVRNLALTIIPIAWAAFFIFGALTNIVPSYAAQVGSANLIPVAVQLAQQGLGLHRNFMFLWQSGETFEVLNTAAVVGYAAFAVATVVTAGIAIARGRLTPRLWDVRAHRWWPMLRHAAPWMYLGGTVLVVIVLGARSLGAAAYYLPIATWAFLAVTFLGIRWIGASFSSRKMVLATLAALLAVPALLAYVSNFTDHTTPVRLQAASDRMADAGAILRGALTDREVSAVSWRMLELPDTSFFVTRGDPATYQPGDDIWPWLVGDRLARPGVTPLLEGTLDGLREQVGSYAGPGEVLMVMTEDYELELLAYEGRILWDPSAPPAP